MNLLEYLQKRTIKLNYYNPHKQHTLKLSEKKKTKKKHSIPEDKGQLFTDIFAM